MSRTVVIEGKTVEDAINKACKELGVSKESLKHDVISYGASGIFGLVGFKKAKIKAFLPQDKGQQQGFVKPKEEPKEEPKAIKEKDEPEACIEDNETTDLGPPKEQEGGALSQNENAEMEQSIRIGEKMIGTIIDRITEDATIETTHEVDGITFRIKGGNAGMLIGKKGQTLEAIQYITEKAINKQSEKRRHILVDIEGYLESKISRLEGMARKTAEKVKRTGKPISVGQMNSQDRKIIHIALKDDSGIRTQSMGEGYYRKLVVFPKGFSRKKRKGPKSQDTTRQ